MRTILMACVVVLVASLSACSKHPAECDCTSETQTRLRARLGLTASATSTADAKRVVVCSADDPRACAFKVLVTPKADNVNCKVRLPYCVVCVRRGGTDGGKTPYLPKITWVLEVNGKETSDYVFNTSAGIDILHAGGGGADDFLAAGHDGRASRFKWEAGPDSAKRAHKTLVYPAGDPKPCEEWDPDVINTEN